MRRDWLTEIRNGRRKTSREVSMKAEKGSGEWKGKKTMKEGCLNMEERESMSNVQLRCRYCIAQSIVGGAVLFTHP